MILPSTPRGQDGDLDEYRGLDLNMLKTRPVAGRDSAACWGRCSPEDCSDSGSELDCPLERLSGGPEPPKTPLRILEAFGFLPPPILKFYVDSDYDDVYEPLRIYILRIRHNVED